MRGFFLKVSSVHLPSTWSLCLSLPKAGDQDHMSALASFNPRSHDPKRADMLLAQLASVLMCFASRLGAGCPSSTSYWPFSLSLAGHMTDLIYAEKDLVQSLKEYILVEEAKLSKIKRCLMS